MGIKNVLETMEYSDDTDIYINEMHKEYKRIEKEWLGLHYKISIGVMIFAMLVECIMAVILVESGILEITVRKFLIKYMFIPSGMNFICILIDAIAMHAKCLSQKQKIYTVSLVFVIVSFVIFTVHCVFTVTCMIYTGAIMLTVIYASYRVTIITASASFFSIIISELFTKWDPDKISIYEDTLQLSNFLVMLFILIAFSAVCMVAIRFQKKKNEASIQLKIERHQLQKSLQIDEMTGIFNRKALHNALKEIEEHAKDEEYILAIVDLDNFKGVNDNGGHYLGDRCLIEFSKVLRKNCGKSIPYRYGGDEFCLLFRNSKVEEAKKVCERIKTQLNSLSFEEQPKLRLTASFGLAVYTKNIDASDLFVQADRALYKAKETRDSVYVYPRAEMEYQ